MDKAEREEIKRIWKGSHNFAGLELICDLEAAEARIVELEASRRWIPVGERLPEEGEEVSVCLPDGFRFVGKYFGDDGKWRAMHGHSFSLSGSSWQSLSPSPIQADEQAQEKPLLIIGQPCPTCGQKTPCAHYHADYFCPHCTSIPCQCEEQEREG